SSSWAARAALTPNRISTRVRTLNTWRVRATRRRACTPEAKGPSAAPPRFRSAHVDVDEGRMGRCGGIEPDAALKPGVRWIGEQLFDDVREILRVVDVDPAVVVEVVHPALVVLV